ncbi:MAG: RIP metalloprotease RseP [Caldimicrobium sp.]|nr:RIP metalloprotease RseP [Caldimicrobium sp.]MCX7873038.1 RIP metalloprotease RseP [Caldimicrobium sp.]MDW8094853.1 RIP metalloprotease RseP [Caldimicrobium sp.]
MWIYIIATIVVIGILVFVHELGHFWAARRMGVRVEIFSIGFGPKILSFVRGDTEYRISSIPFGGYVKLYGEHPDILPSIIEKEKAFAFKKTWQKALIVLAGPLANFLFAFLAFWLIFTLIGKTYTPPKIGEILPSSPAEIAGLQVGDHILEIDGKKIKSFEELLMDLRQRDTSAPIFLKIKRGEEILDIWVTPQMVEGTNLFGKKTRIPMLGIKASPERLQERLNPLSAFILAGERVYDFTALTFLAIFKLFTGELPFSTLGGPITIGKFAGESAKMGLMAFFTFMALLSINLAVINILPLPMLDGGHLVIFAIEALKGSPLPLKTQELLFKIGLILIIGLTVVVFYNDIIRLLSGWKLP